MNNIFKYFVLSILLSNCSLDTKSGIWTDKENLKEDIKVERDSLTKIFLKKKNFK